MKIEIYTTPICGYCVAAKRLLKSKSVPFTEINVMINPKNKATMIKRANGKRTVPQIFIDGRHIGGYDDMARLDKDGKLDPLLGLGT